MNGSYDNRDREEQLRDFDKKSNTDSVISSGDSNGRRGGMVIGVVAVAAILFLAVIYRGNNEPTATDDTREFSIAGRKPVPELKLLEPPVPLAPPPPPAPAIPTFDPELERIKQQEAQASQMLEARKKSAVVVLKQERSSQTGGNTSANGLVTGEQKPRSTDANSQFAENVAGKGMQVSTAGTIELLEYKILKGKLIEAVLEPRVNSDLPGMICAVVQQDVYGTQGRRKLIPWGSRVCGVYKSQLRKGQDRIFVVWNDLVRPDGVLITLDSPGSDQLGTTGMGGQVDTHFAEIFGSSALLAIIGAGAANMGVGDDDQYNSNAYYRQEVQEAAATTAQQVMSPYINMPPTVVVPQGSTVKIYVNRILDFTDLYSEEIKTSRNGGVKFIR